MGSRALARVFAYKCCNYIFGFNVSSKIGVVLYEMLHRKCWFMKNIKRVKSKKKKRFATTKKVDKRCGYIRKRKPTILSANETANYFGVSIRTVYRLAQQKMIPAMRRRNKWRFNIAKVMRKIQIKPRQRTRE